MPANVHPTEEQQVALSKFQSGRNLKVSAFAGTGKTTTLSLLANSRRAKGAYLAFNRSIANESRDKFPREVDCRTTHSLAWRAIKSSHRFSSGKMNDNLYPKQLSEELQLADRVFGGKMRLDGTQQASLVLRTIRCFCESADDTLDKHHIPRMGRLLGTADADRRELDDWVLQTAKSVWARKTSDQDDIPLGHDGYLKLWALGHPRLGYEFIMLDEAQDTNAVVLGVLAEQEAQIVYVGDKHQQIYEWRGAVNAMEKLTDCDESFLTQSFRFGPPIASAATNVLRTLGERRNLRGNPDRQSDVLFSGTARTILARTNSTVISEVLASLNANETPCVIGGTAELEQLVKDVFSLKEGKPGKRPELFGFRDWSEVIVFSQTEEGAELRMFVQLVLQHGEKALYKAVKSAVEDESQADVVISTTHKAKGREWESVRIAADFASSASQDNQPLPEEEVRLFYVAMTRAKNRLIVDRETLEFFQSNAWKQRSATKTQAAKHPAAATSQAWKTMPVHPTVSQSTGTLEQVRKTPVTPQTRKAPAVLPTRPPRPLEEILSSRSPAANTAEHASKEAEAIPVKSPVTKQSLLGKFFQLFGG
jgi:hypothetical protein